MNPTVPFEQSDRFHALDALRAYALLLGIVLHATLSFLPGVENLGWSIVDNQPSGLLSVLFYVIHMFRMTIFFVIAGFFAHMMFHRQGAGYFLKARSKRILIPLVVGWILLMPLIVAGILWGASQLGKPYVPIPPPAGTNLAFPLAHLWFLWLLFCFYLVSIAVQKSAVRCFSDNAQYMKPIDRFIKWLLSSGTGPILLALPVAISLYHYDSWELWAGIPTPDKALIPNLPAALAYGTAFGLGWLLHRQTDLLHKLASHWPVYLVVAIALTVGCAYHGGTSPATSANSLRDLPRLIHVTGYCIAAWSWTFGLFGAALRFFAVQSPIRRYLSDASYWLYLAHLPLIMALQAMMMHWNLHWSLKFAGILFLAMTVLLLSYHYLVRPTFVGAFLNGRRYPQSLKAGLPVGFPNNAPR